MYVEIRNIFHSQIVCCNASSFLYAFCVPNHRLIVNDKVIQCFSVHENVKYLQASCRLKHYVCHSQCCACSNVSKSVGRFFYEKPEYRFQVLTCDIPCICTVCIFPTLALFSSLLFTFSGLHVSTP